MASVFLRVVRWLKHQHGGFQVRQHESDHARVQSDSATRIRQVIQDSKARVSRAEVEQVAASLSEPRGRTPDALERWGIRPLTDWRADETIHARMPDGYWTPWHLAVAALQQAEQAREQAEVACAKWCEDIDHELEAVFYYKAKADAAEQAREEAQKELEFMRVRDADASERILSRNQHLSAQAVRIEKLEADRDAALQARDQLTAQLEVLEQKHRIVIGKHLNLSNERDQFQQEKDDALARIEQLEKAPAQQHASADEAESEEALTDEEMDSLLTDYETWQKAREARERTAWEAGFALCRSYGDNWVHFDGEQKERHWATFLGTQYDLAIRTHEGDSATQLALRGLVNAAMVIIGNAVDFNERRQVFLCTVCRYRDPLGDEGTKLHADECPIYRLHAACDVAGPLIEPATWADAGATQVATGATGSAPNSSSSSKCLSCIALLEARDALRGVLVNLQAAITAWDCKTYQPQLSCIAEMDVWKYAREAAALSGSLVPPPEQEEETNDAATRIGQLDVDPSPQHAAGDKASS